MSITETKDIAERSVIGSVLLDSKTLAIAREIIDTNDFFSKCNQVVFDAFCTLEDSGKQITLASVYSLLMNDSCFNSSGGITYLQDCTSDLPSASQIEHYAGLVRANSLRRKLVSFGKQIEIITNNPIEDIDSEICRLGDELLDLSSTSPITPWSSLEEILKSMCDTMMSDKKDLRIKSGFVDLDAKLSGFRPGSLTIIAARPAMGKTALGVNILQNVVFDQHLPAALFSLEMTKDEVGKRIISCMANIDGNAIRNEELSDDEWGRYLAAFDKYLGAKIYVDDTPALDISILRDRAKRMQRQFGIKMIVVDYLQLMISETKKNNSSREQEVARISRGLKALAKELHIPVIALSQLNRAVDTRACKQPVLSDLRESGSIEQDADTVLFIHREDYYNNNAEKTNEAEIIIAKQRSGPTGIIKLHWDGRYTRFSNLERNNSFEII